MSLVCEKGCGKCCEVGGTGQLLLATEAEAERIALRMGWGFDKTAGGKIEELELDTVRMAPCPLYADGACNAYDIRPSVCRAYQCDGENWMVKSGQSMADSIALAQSMLGIPVADLREWFNDRP